MSASLDRFAGRVVIVAPHMDDEVLACGGLIARLRARGTDVHVVYATDGMRSPSPVIPGDAISPDLGAVRMRESEAAMRLLGVPKDHLHFLRLPEARLREHLPELGRLVIERVRTVRADHVLVPFRYDRHPDHLAVNRVVTAAVRAGAISASVSEYFVYHRWRLLPKRDVRTYLRSEHVLSVDIGEVAAMKRAALACFESQTTRFYPWQTRPILTAKLLDEECAAPEMFLRYDPSADGASVLCGPVAWIRVAHRAEPVLQRWKYLVKASLQRLLERARDPW